ncbi:GGDEF domain-containing protein [Psychromonas ingrahamii]|nr:GGDEF domain-containing protein [Psychromonas ingrahamii]
MEFGQEEIKRAQRTKNKLWLLILDIDYFKKINDTEGHDMGDQLLVTLSQMLENSVCSIDLVSCIGGEEFSIILLDTNRQGAARVAESIRMKIETSPA